MRTAQASEVAFEVQRPVPPRDWAAWYDELGPEERRDLRATILEASYDDVKESPELRQFFLFHSEDLAQERVPGTDRIAELHGVLHHLRDASDADTAATRRKAVGFLLAAYQSYLRDNPWA